MKIVTWIWLGVLGIVIIGSILAVLMTVRPLFNVEGMSWNERPMDKESRKGQSCRVLQTIRDKEDTDTTIEIVDPTCEDGLPHTVDKTTIRMTEKVWKSDRKEEILTHERIHLAQRRNPDAWKRFYMEEWGYTFPDVIPKEVSSRKDIRSNPDTWEKPFSCWQNRYWFIPVYDSSLEPTLKSTHVVIWDSQMESWSDIPPVEWNNLFCAERCPHQYEHPHEISAEYSTDSSWDTPAARSFREFQKRYRS